MNPRKFWVRNKLILLSSEICFYLLLSIFYGFEGYFANLEFQLLFLGTFSYNTGNKHILLKNHIIFKHKVIRGQNIIQFKHKICTLCKSICIILYFSVNKFN